MLSSARKDDHRAGAQGSEAKKAVEKWTGIVGADPLKVEPPAHAIQLHRMHGTRKVAGLDFRTSGQRGWDAL
jgi:hypothetical protein